MTVDFGVESCDRTILTMFTRDGGGEAHSQTTLQYSAPTRMYDAPKTMLAPDHESVVIT